MTHIYLTIELALEAGQDDKLATQFKGVAYSGGRAQPHNAVIDLATLKLSTDMPLLAGHDHGAVVGNITQAAKDGGQVSVTGDIYSDIDDTAAGIVKKAARFLTSFDDVGNPRTKEIPTDACVMSVEKMLGNIGEPSGLVISTKTLAKLVQAASLQLAERASCIAERELAGSSGISL